MYNPCTFFLFKKGGNDPVIQPPQAVAFTNTSVQVNGTNNGSSIYKFISVNPVVKLSFSSAINKSTAASNILFNEGSGVALPIVISYENGDSSIVVKSSSTLKSFTPYNIIVSQGLLSSTNKNLAATVNVAVTTGIDSSDKFPLLGNNALLDLVQRQTFKYFWDFGHPTSGMARE